jgi:hypothetical protein
MTPNGLKGNEKMDNQNSKMIDGIICDAKNCVHHAVGDHCTAKEIKVGYQSSCQCNETACTTFRQKD